MSSIGERYEGNFLEGGDLPKGALCPVTIESIADPDTEKDASGKIIRKAIIQFKGKSKRLILNKTNYKVLKAMFGKESPEWIDKTVNIQRRFLDAAHAFGHADEICLRVIPPVGLPIPKSARDYMGSPTPSSERKS